MAQSKSSKRWLQEHFRDPFVKKARSEGYRSRAAFKLLEIHQKDKLFQPGMTVVDLGAAPGGWTQVVAEILGDRGQIVAMDILPMEPLPGVKILQGDFTEPEVFDNLQQLLKNNSVDLVISDMAPNLSGERSVDQPKAMYLVELALELARLILKPDGGLLVKVFQGQGFDEFLKQLRLYFKKVVIRKPKASRGRSAEVYVLCKGFKTV